MRFTFAKKSISELIQVIYEYDFHLTARWNFFNQIRFTNKLVFA